MTAPEMGDAAELADAMTSAAFPYRRKWTKAQVKELRARELRLSDAMTDAVGMLGQHLNVDGTHLRVFAMHLALAGADVDDDRAYITAIIHNREGMPADFHQWVLKSEYEPAPPDPDETRAKAVAAADQIRRQLPPDVRRAVAEMMAAEYEKATEEDGPP